MTPIHHSFEVKGWPESKVVWSFILAQFVLLLVALSVNAAAVNDHMTRPYGVAQTGGE